MNLDFTPEENAFRQEVLKVTKPCSGCMYGSFPEMTISMRYLKAKMERIKTVLAVWLPDPFTVATCMEKSLITARSGSPCRGETGDTSRVDIDS